MPEHEPTHSKRPHIASGRERPVDQQHKQGAVDGDKPGLDRGGVLYFFSNRPFTPSTTSSPASLIFSPALLTSPRSCLPLPWATFSSSSVILPTSSSALPSALSLFAENLSSKPVGYHLPEETPVLDVRLWRNSVTHASIMSNSLGSYVQGVALSGLVCGAPLFSAVCTGDEQVVLSRSSLRFPPRTLQVSKGS